MLKLTRVHIRAAISLSWLFAVTSSQAAFISDSLLFETQDQNPWSQGPSGSILVEQFVGTRWGTYRETGDNPLFDLLGLSPSAKHYSLGGFVGGQTDNACIGVETGLGCAGFRTDIDTTTGAQVDLYTSGQVGVYVGAELSAGNIDIRLPVRATVALPDQVVAGEFFTVATSGQTLTGASITADAPSFRAFVDGVFDTENRFSGEACVVGECTSGTGSFDLNLGRFSVLEVDSGRANPWSILGVEIPGVPLAKITKRAPGGTDPDGIDETPPPDPNPAKPPILLEVEANSLAQVTSETVTGNNLGLSTSDPDVLDINFSLTGFAEALLRPPGSPALLKQKIPLISIGSPFPNVNLTWTIANIEVGPVLGLQRAYNFNPDPAVRLQFDKPITRIEKVQIGTRPVVVGEVCVGRLFGFCVDYEDVIELEPIYGMRPITHDDGIIEILLGENAQLSFNDGIGQLLDRTYFMSDSIFNNKTALTIALEATAQFGCIDIPGIGEGCIVEESIRSAPGTLAASNRTFTMGGFNEVNFAEIFRFTDSGGTTDPSGNPPPTTLPEPGTLFLLLFGFLVVASTPACRRKCGSSSQYTLAA